jgi:hypothetical protein
MARGMKETFNCAHSSLRNVVERSFGVFKQKWRMMYGIPSFPVAKQTKIIVACMALHNFIREHDDDDEDFDQAELDEYIPQGHISDDSNNFTDGQDEEPPSDETMNGFRDRIAAALYNNTKNRFLK